MIIRQLKVGSMDNFCYLVGCEQTRKAMVIDPGANVKRILSEAERLGMGIEYIVNTHGHGDHTAGSAKLKLLTGARIVIHALDAASVPQADIRLTDESNLMGGTIPYSVFHTPGHTPGGICLYAEGQLFTGDTLFVGSTGRTDFPGGSYAELERSIRTKLYTLPGNTVILPGHNYGITPTSTIEQERRTNAVIRA